MIFRANLLLPLSGNKINNEQSNRTKSSIFLCKNNTKKYNIAFKLYPTDISQVISFAEKKKFMPQKSTWFHPKPLDGLISCKIIS